MSLFRNPKKVVYAIAFFILLLLIAWSTNLRAEEQQLQVGVGSTIVRGQTELIDVSVLFPDGPGDASWQLSLTLVGDSETSKGYQPNQAALGMMLVDGIGPIDFALGVVFLQNQDAYNGSTANFSLQISYRLTERLGLLVRHWSNAGTISPNLGRDMVLLAFGFR